jgi:hypothetical protein
MKGHKTCLAYRFRTVTVASCRLIFCITTQRYFMAEGRAYDAAKNLIGRRCLSGKFTPDGG